MNEQVSDSAINAAREEREAELVFARLRELRTNPIRGRFDTRHLKAVHAYLFQDLPHHQPGVIRADTHDSWIKQRTLEGRSGFHAVHYMHKGIQARISKTLRAFKVSDAIKGLTPEAAAIRIAGLYGDLDHAHGFHEGNSRTLREFTRELALAAGFALDWVGTGVGVEERNQLYIARDVAVFERWFPGLTENRAMATNDRSEYEAWFVLEKLRRMMGEKSLVAIIRERLARH